MRKLISLLMLIPSLAWATSYHVRPGGSDGANGLSWSSAWQTIGRANTGNTLGATRAVTLPGDIVYVYDGPNQGVANYTEFPNPDSAGSNPTGGGRIKFIGASLSGDPLVDPAIRNRIVLPSGTLSKKYTDIKGMSGGNLTIASTARFDSISWCNFSGFLQNDHGDNWLISDCTFLGSKIQFTYSADTTSTRSKADSLYRCSFPNLGSGMCSSPPNMGDFFNTDSCQFFYNHFVPTAGSCVTGSGIHWRMIYESRGNVWYGNRTDAWNNSNLPFDSFRMYTLNQRDHFWGNTFRKDTVITHNGYTQNCFACDGSDYADKYNSGGTTIDSCYFKNPNYYGLYTNLIMRSTNITYNTILSGSYEAFSVINNAGVTGPNLIDHNTFAGFGFGDYGRYGVFNLGPNAGVVTGTDTTKAFNNIFYSFYPEQQIPTYGIGGHALVSTIGGSGLYKSNWNLYRVKAYKNVIGDRSLISSINSTIGWSRPGDTTTTWASMFKTNQKKECADWLSKYVSGTTAVHQFLDSSFTNFNPQMYSNSTARTMGKSGTYVGSTAFVSMPRIQITTDTLRFLGGNPGDTLQVSLDFLSIGNDSLKIYGATGAGAGGSFCYPPFTGLDCFSQPCLGDFDIFLDCLVYPFWKDKPVNDSNPYIIPFGEAGSMAIRWGKPNPYTSGRQIGNMALSVNDDSKAYRVLVPFIVE